MRVGAIEPPTPVRRERDPSLSQSLGHGNRAMRGELLKLDDLGGDFHASKSMRIRTGVNA